MSGTPDRRLLGYRSRVTSLLLLLAFGAVGVVGSRLVAGGRGLVERCAYSLLFGLSAVPLLAVSAALFGVSYVTPAHLALSAAVWLAGLGWLVRRQSRGPGTSTDAAPDRLYPQSIVLLGAAAVALVAGLFHSDAKHLLSLRSYLDRGEAECFYMLTFSLVEALNPAREAAALPNPYAIISTPGNVLFTAGFYPLLGDQTFRVLQIAFQALLFLFLFLVLTRLRIRWPVALAVAVFAGLNPYMLSIEELDRNTIALALSAAFAHALLSRPDAIALHGALFGLVAGTGLRFLPLVFAVPLVAFHARRGRTVRDWAVLAATAAAVFAVNVPHLFEHQLESMGEPLTFPTLLWMALADAHRTPFLPYPNAVLYFLSVVSHFGVVVTALVAFGAARMLVTRRSAALAGLFVLGVTGLVLGVQRDWLESDKIRILLWALVPAFVFLAVGLDALLDRERRGRRFAELAVALGVTIAAVAFARGVTVPADATTYGRKPVYQSETPAFARHYQERFAAVSLLPNYDRLYLKLDLTRKREEERALRTTLFGADGGGATEPAPATAQVASTGTGRFTNLRIDLERLVTSPAEAVTRVEQPEDEPFVDLEDQAHLLDVYFAALKVSWQPEPLTVAIFPGRPESTQLGELNVELNAFAGFGRDEDGFERVNPIHLLASAERRAKAFRSGMTALPRRDARPVLYLRIPSEMRVVLRNWLVSTASGTPFRTDAWDISAGRDGAPKLGFFPFEPESHL